jgi:hypothetical protein
MILFEGVGLIIERSQRFLERVTEGLNHMRPRLIETRGIAWGDRRRRFEEEKFR